MALKPLCILHLAALLALCSSFQAPAHDKQELMAKKHEKWMSEFNRTYKDDVEKAMRFKVFQQNAAYIDAFNQQAAGNNMTYTLGLNKFSDLTNQEFLARYTGFKSGPRSMPLSSTIMSAEVTEIPESIDWRLKGVVSIVKDQGECGCCWAFAAIAAVEGFYKIKTGELIPWSEQELLDCGTDKFHGCDLGGDQPQSGFQYITGKNGSMTTGTDYTYNETQGDRCRSDEFRRYNVYIDTIVDVPTNDESALMEAVVKQPVAVAIDGGGPNFQSYRGGIFNGPCGTKTTHAVTVVGYGVDSGTNFWLVKNSWGLNWGEGGYMRLQKDVDAAEGLCGLATQASYPTAKA